MESVLTFVFKTTLGQILLSVILTIALTTLCEWILSICKTKIKHRRLTNHLVRTGSAYIWGRRCQYAKRGTYEQNLVIAQFIHDFLIIISKSIFFVLFSVIIMLLLSRIIRYVVLPILGTLLWFQYKKYADLKLCFDSTIELVFGEEQLNSEMSGMEEYWNEMINNKNCQS